MEKSRNKLLEFAKNAGLGCSNNLLTSVHNVGLQNKKRIRVVSESPDLEPAPPAEPVANEIPLPGPSQETVKELDKKKRGLYKEAAQHLSVKDANVHLASAKRKLTEFQQKLATVQDSTDFMGFNSKLEKLSRDMSKIHKNYLDSVLKSVSP